jgi:predicted enzyme related to lactoylglutathione lyase
MPSPVVYFQIGSADPDAVSKFCHEVFDWEMTPGAGRIPLNIETNARKVEPNDIYVLGSVFQLPEGSAPYTSLFVRVADLRGTLKKATDRGATIVAPPNFERPGATSAVIDTPIGIRFGVVQL